MISEHIKVGIHSVKQAKFRSFFTMLGIIIGVVSVVTIISLGEGVKRQISGQTADLGTNLTSVKPGKLIKRDSGGKINGINLFASTGIASITPKDLESIRTVAGVKSATSVGTISGLPSFNDKTFSDGIIISSDPSLHQVIDHKVEFGTFFNEDEAKGSNAVIGSKLAEKLFKESVPLGKQVTIKGQNFTVQGVFSQFSESPVSSSLDLNNAVFIPQNQATALNGSSPPIYEILVKRDETTDSVKLINDINTIVKTNHGGQEDFSVLDQTETSATSDELVRLLTKMIVGMATITLLIAGIGIMNVMLVSVSERNHEIGIRKAIGATDYQIRNQFILESAILAVWGAIFGVVASIFLNIILRIVTDLEPVILWRPILFSSIVAVAVGVLFGSVASLKAAKKDPITSLRS